MPLIHVLFGPWTCARSSFLPRLVQGVGRFLMPEVSNHRLFLGASANEASMSRIVLLCLALTSALAGFAVGGLVNRHRTLQVFGPCPLWGTLCGRYFEVFLVAPGSPVPDLLEFQSLFCGGHIDCSWSLRSWRLSASYLSDL